jgi:hypothetical protein
MMRRTMAVLLKDMRKPSISASPVGTCILKRMAKTAKIVRITWSDPPTRTYFLIFRRSLRETSIPTVKRRRTTPISARTATCSDAFTRPSPWGPAKIPVSKKPTIVGARSLWKRKRTATDSTNMTTISLSSASSIIQLIRISSI